MIVKDPCSGFGLNGDRYHIMKGIRYVTSCNEVEIKLAERFHKLVREELADDLEEIDKRNVAYGKGTCATHDFCDANVLMDDAFRQIMGRDFEVDAWPDTAMWNKAWDVAWHVGFNSKWA